jgi:type IV conjugative transfer system coupling protein TraD
MNDSNSKLFTRGGQIAFHNLRMFIQINKALWKTVFLLMVATIIGLTYLLTPKEILITFCQYQKASMLGWFDNYYNLVLPIKGKAVAINSKALLKHPYFAMKANLIWTSVFKAFMWSLTLTATGFIGLVSFFVFKGKKQGESKFLRGSTIAKPYELAKQIKRDKMASDLVIDGVPIIKNSEVQHFLIHGTIGTGKSQLMMKFLEQIRKRGDRVIIYDKGCTFTSHFFDDERDVILNPFDARCANWDMWKEAPRDSDFDNMAESLIPLHGQSDPFWVDAARTVFSSTATRLRHKKPSLDMLLDMLLTGDFENLEPFLQGTPAATLITNKAEKMAISIRSVITTYLKSLQSLKGIADSGKEPFSIRDYIANDDNKGWLFISSRGDQHASLKPLISMWLAMASIAMLSLTENKDRRIWFICDELPSLHKLPMLQETIAEVRKFGGCFMLGMQSQAQLCNVYGHDSAKSIFDLLNTRFFFRSPSHDMANFVARELGEKEVEEATESYSYGANSIRDGISVGKQKTIRKIVTYPEIMQLKDLDCFVRLPAQLPIAKLSLSYKKRQAVAVDCIQREPKEDTNAGTQGNQEEENSAVAIAKSAGQERVYALKKPPSARKEKTTSTRARSEKKATSVNTPIRDTKKPAKTQTLSAVSQDEKSIAYTKDDIDKEMF